MENADLSSTNRLLTNTMDVFTIPQNKFGRTIVPNTINILDNSLDKPYTIVDDGKCNLIFSGSVFATYEIDNLLNSQSQNASIFISSIDCNGNSSNSSTAIITSSVGHSTFLAYTQPINVVVSGGLAPYVYNWQIGGDNSDSWTINNETKYISLQYKVPVNSLSDIFYSNTYVACQIIDANQNELISNIIYIANCPFSSSVSNPNNPPVERPPFEPPPPTTDTILTLQNTGYLLNNGDRDNNYILYNYIPDSKLSSPWIFNVSSSYAIDYIQAVNGGWFGYASNTAQWISPDATSPTGVRGNREAGTFVYRTYFDLVDANNNPINPNGYFLTGSWAVDNSGSIYLNGLFTNNTITSYGSSDGSSFTQLHGFNITGGFVSGRNYLDFYVVNPYYGRGLYGILYNPAGLFVKFGQNTPVQSCYNKILVIQISNTGLRSDDKYDIALNGFHIGSVDFSMGGVLNKVVLIGDSSKPYQWLDGSDNIYSGFYRENLSDINTSLNLVSFDSSLVKYNQPNTLTITDTTNNIVGEGHILVQAQMMVSIGDNVLVPSSCGLLLDDYLSKSFPTTPPQIYSIDTSNCCASPNICDSFVPLLTSNWAVANPIYETLTYNFVDDALFFTLVGTTDGFLQGNSVSFKVTYPIGCYQPLYYKLNVIAGPNSSGFVSIGDDNGNTPLFISPILDTGYLLGNWSVEGVVYVHTSPIINLEVVTNPNENVTITGTISTSPIP
jgi:hypothetical protein